MKFAVISDIHANKEALEAVLADIDSQNINEIYCLGDTIGYGPEPLEVVDMLRRNDKVKECIMGNHEEYILSDNETGLRFNTMSRVSLYETGQQINPRFNIITATMQLFDKKRATRKVCFSYLKNFKESASKGNLHFHHGSPIIKYDYIESSHQALAIEKNKQRNRDQGIYFIGHTHLPFYSSLTDIFEFEKKINNKKFEVSKHGYTLINVGSVGQPRDRDNRACYGVFDGESIEYRRVKYDVEKTQGKLLEIGSKKDLGVKNIYEALAHRLEEGK